MGAKGLRLYLILAVLALLIAVPVGRYMFQRYSIEQDIRSIGMEYSLKGPKSFRESLDDVVRRARLDPEDVEIEIKESKKESKVSVEVRYLGRMKILFFPVEKPVVIQQKIPLYVLE